MQFISPSLSTHAVCLIPSAFIPTKPEAESPINPTSRPGPTQTETWALAQERRNDTRPAKHLNLNIGYTYPPHGCKYTHLPSPIYMAMFHPPPRPSAPYTIIRWKVSARRLSPNYRRRRLEEAELGGRIFACFKLVSG
ncbi:hypothetical protein BJX70DRAFT_214645 [Aspergillus crustosus]